MSLTVCAVLVHSSGFLGVKFLTLIWPSANLAGHIDEC